LPTLKKTLSPTLLLAQEEEVQQLIARYEAHAAHGTVVAELELLERTAVFKSANALVGQLLQQTVERIDNAYQPKAGASRTRKATVSSGCPRKKSSSRATRA